MVRVDTGRQPSRDVRWLSRVLRVPSRAGARLGAAIGTALLLGCGTPEIGDSGVDVLNDAVVAALRHRDPDAAETMVRHVTADTGEGAAPAEYRLLAYLRSKVVPIHALSASDAAVEQYLRTTTTGLQELRAASYYRCYVFLFGGGRLDAERIALEGSLSATTRESARLAITRLIETADTLSASVDEEAAWHILDNIVIPNLPAWHGERVMVLRDSAARNIDRTAACDVTIDVVKAAIDLSPPEGPILRRYLLARYLKTEE
jgi:hypothetical protein